MVDNKVQRALCVTSESLFISEDFVGLKCNTMCFPLITKQLFYSLLITFAHFPVTNISIIYFYIYVVRFWEHISDSDSMLRINSMRHANLHFISAKAWEECLIDTI